MVDFLSLGVIHLVDCLLIELTNVGGFSIVRVYPCGVDVLLLGFIHVVDCLLLVYLCEWIVYWKG